MYVCMYVCGFEHIYIYNYKTSYIVKQKRVGGDRGMGSKLTIKKGLGHISVDHCIIFVLSVK